MLLLQNCFGYFKSCNSTQILDSAHKFLQKKKKICWALDWDGIESISPFRENWHFNNIEVLQSMNMVYFPILGLV